MNRPIRLALGSAVLVAEQIRRSPAPTGTMIGVGLVTQATARARTVARRALAIPTRIASRSVGDRPRQWLVRVTTQARQQGEATLAAARADTTAFARQSLQWLETRAIPQFVDGLLPHLIDQVVPRLIEGTLPEIRDRVLPALINDLATDEQIRELVLHGGERAVSGAAQHLRTATAGADDRVESAVRQFRLWRRGR